MNDGDICLADCATTYTILREKKYFLNLIVTNASVCDAPDPATRSGCRAGVPRFVTVTGTL